MRETSNLHVVDAVPLLSPDELKAELPITDAAAESVHNGREQLRAVLRGSDPRVLVIVGPCSIHDPQAALEYGLTPIVCVGERLDEREGNRTEEVLGEQFDGGLAPLAPAQFAKLVIAYEPVWAIGTGKTATPRMAADAHRFIREKVAGKFGDALASAVRILYGGSVKPDNVKNLMAEEEIDGALVGGASLDPKSFAAIVKY